MCAFVKMQFLLNLIFRQISTREPFSERLPCKDQLDPVGTASSCLPIPDCGQPNTESLSTEVHHYPSDGQKKVPQRQREN